MPTEAKPKKILNNASDSVDEYIEGLLLQYPNHLKKLENHKVLFAADRNDSQVQVICGGGSGHEPSHAGIVGLGMLSTAVCGGVFASPPVSTCVAAIRATASGSGGVLLIIKNYTGDRLNFGMAAEKAEQEGIKVKMVVVAEDCSLPRTKGITGARGLAGTVLVNKIAGSASAAGKSLDEVAEVSERACARMGSIGLALDAVTVPGAKSVNSRLDDKTIEVGLGIHGEEGIKQSPLLKADDMAREMINDIQKYGREKDGNIIPMFEKGDEVVVLVNNLGGCSNFEMSILARSCVKSLESDEFGVKARRVIVGCLMTSFNMYGASLTILNVTGQPDIVEYLDAPTSAPAWVACDVWDQSASERPSTQYVKEKIVDDEKLEKPSLQIEGFEEMAKKMIISAANKLVEVEPLLTKYDTITGDGDCGFTMQRGAVEVLRRLEDGTLPTDHPVTLFAALADAMSSVMGGASGVFTELMFRKMSTHLALREGSGDIDEAEMSRAVQAGVDAISLYGGAKVGSRTMLDALIPAVKVLIETNDLEVAAQEASLGAFGTARMAAATAGRSNYISSSLIGTPDPGAVAVSTVFEALAEASYVYD